MLICATCVRRGVVEVVALLGFIQRASAAVAQFGRSLIKSRRRSRISRAHPRAAISAQRDVILSLNIDLALLTDEFRFWNLEQSSTEKAGIPPTYHEPFQEVVTSPLPAPLGAEQNFCVSVLAGFLPHVHRPRLWARSNVFTSSSGASPASSRN